MNNVVSTYSYVENWTLDLLTCQRLDARPFEQARAGIAAIVLVLVDVFAARTLAGVPANYRDICRHLALVVRWSSLGSFVAAF